MQGKYQLNEIWLITKSSFSVFHFDIEKKKQKQASSIESLKMIFQETL